MQRVSPDFLLQTTPAPTDSFPYQANWAEGFTMVSLFFVIVSELAHFTLSPTHEFPVGPRLMVLSWTRVPDRLLWLCGRRTGRRTRRYLNGKESEAKQTHRSLRQKGHVVSIPASRSCHYKRVLSFLAFLIAAFFPSHFLRHS